MTRNLDSERETSIECRRRRVFRIRLWTATGCYLIANLALYQWGHGETPWRVVWALLPVVFMFWVIVLIVLRVRRMDEYQTKLIFPGLAVGFAVSMLTALTLGTLSSAGFAVPNAGWPVAIIGILAWEITNVLVKAPVA